RDDGFFTYPGNVFSQFMAFYDETPGRAGLYLQAEDPRGITKNLYFNSAKSKATGHRRAYLYFTHFNVFPSVGSGAPPDAQRAEFEHLELPDKLGYPVVIAPFHGDWLDATRMYRDWVTGLPAPFISAGPLVGRDDLGPGIKSTAYGFSYQFPVAPGP